jgi:hypothetical protein
VFAAPAGGVLWLMLGNASAAMTLAIYSGLFDDDLDALADRLDAAATIASEKISADLGIARTLR